MKKWLAVAVLTVLALTGAVVVGGVATHSTQVQSANGGGIVPPFPPC
jgi:hypothetical protein